MRDDHLLAHNLFTRLVSYTPRVGQGGKTRTAMEDFFTEALAWCLRSQCFRGAFFDLITEAASQPVRGWPYGNNTNLEIHTQLPFAESIDEDPEDAGDVGAKRRRFDLVIQSATDRSLVIVVENKLSWRFTENQLPAYREELVHGHRFKDFGTKLLVVLSPSGEMPDFGGTVPMIAVRWSGVQRKLAEFAGVSHSSPSEHLDTPAIRFVCAQFAEFLKEKGLAPMKISKTDRDQVGTWITGLEAQESMSRILSAIRANRKHWAGKPPIFEVGCGGHDDGSRWFGYYRRGFEHFYIGFRLRDKQRKSELHLWIQMTSPENGKFKKGLMARMGKLGADISEEDGGGILNISKKASGTELDGNADLMREWFENILAGIDETHLLSA